MTFNLGARLTWISRADIWLASIACVVLAGMMVFVFAGAILRYAFTMPIHGGNEILEMASVAAVMFTVPYCTMTDSHVRIDLLEPVLGRIGRAVTELLYRVIAIIVVWFLTKSFVARSGCRAVIRNFFGRVLLFVYRYSAVFPHGKYRVGRWRYLGLSDPTLDRLCAVFHPDQMVMSCR